MPEPDDAAWTQMSAGALRQLIRTLMAERDEARLVARVLANLAAQEGANLEISNEAAAALVQAFDYRREPMPERTLLQRARFTLDATDLALGKVDGTAFNWLRATVERMLEHLEQQHANASGPAQVPGEPSRETVAAFEEPVPSKDALEMANDIVHMNRDPREIARALQKLMDERDRADVEVGVWATDAAREDIRAERAEKKLAELVQRLRKLRLDAGGIDKPLDALIDEYDPKPEDES